ncbi:serine/threonine-protein kinase PEPKR2 [Dioscorea cayenensis subsp. rotundata]|uniref:Serine/threonine-protein kinase PEPKR2 n=1 Tax=Dioscorea cayennensis subsp. rotundata TaxID=55577 RepID=A0AB40BJV0_DIOCR|nr:serine/threonine-protein kinase PEPKR2 [Dioscorea cayenensis subsp. rotundata]
MESLPRKRKGGKSTSPFESHVSDGFDQPRRIKKKCRGANPRSDLEKLGSGGGDSTAAVVMTAPPAGRGSADTPGRGLKRKLGCIEPAARIGRKKKLELEYVLGLEIGQGRFGSVRLCRSRAGGEEFACKSLPKNGEETVHREVEIMQHLSGHPGIVTLKGVYEDKESFHLVMELCSGGRLLDQMVKEGRYSEQRAANLIKELVLVIRYCHEMGVVHRDIKPENVLMTSSGKMKLADFGLSVRVSSGQKLSGIAGSPAYVAPEVLSGNYSEKVDIWGAGVLLHALLVGILPFQGDSLEAVFDAIKNVNLNFHGGVWEQISELARDLVSKMLTRDVSLRLTADEILVHPWILFYTECPSKALASNRSRVQSSVVEKRINFGFNMSSNLSASSASSSQKSEEQEDCGFVDALAAAISRVRISEPKRSRLCGPASPIQQQCSSNVKANLCTAF